MSKLIPNSFQTPNLLIDQLAHLLTPEENTVLAKAVREILGWHSRIESRKAPIALAVFVDGKFNEAGDRLCYGCGLSIGAVRRALVALDKHAILVKVGRASHDGQTYWLQADDTKIKWVELNNRLREKKAKRQKQTKKATKVGGIVRRQGVTSDDMSGVTSDDMSGVTSDDNKETHLETQEETHIQNPQKISPNGKKPLDPALHILQAQEDGVPKVTDPYPIDQYWGHRDRALALHASQRNGKKANEAQRVSLIILVEQEAENFDLALLEKSYVEAGANWTGNSEYPPIARVIEVYEAGGDYDRFAAKKWPKESEDKNATAIKLTDEQRAAAKALNKMYG